jgi:hypothetical protein
MIYGESRQKGNRCRSIQTDAVFKHHQYETRTLVGEKCTLCEQENRDDHKSDDRTLVVEAHALVAARAPALGCNAGATSHTAYTGQSQQHAAGRTWCVATHRVVG